jgi:hypothetical protein
MTRDDQVYGYGEQQNDGHKDADYDGHVSVVFLSRSRNCNPKKTT